MRPHRLPAVLITIALFGAPLAGCSPDNGTVAAPDGVALARTANESIPISGACETAFVPPTFPPPPVIRQVDQGICHLSHLGRTALYSVQDIDLATGTQTSIELTYTAANGDILRAVNTGTNVPNGPGVRFSATTTFVGGTGRFANATGQARIEGTASFLTNTASYTVDGWIVYEAAASKSR